MFTEAGCRPVPGPTVFHQEHGREAGWQASARRNVAKIRSRGASASPPPRSTPAVVAKADPVTKRPEPVTPAIATPALPPVMLVTAVGTSGGGCQEGIRELKSLLGPEAGVVCTHASGQPAYELAAGDRFVPPAELAAALAHAELVIDEGTGQLGHTIPYQGEFIQAIRCSNPDTWAAARKHRGTTVYCSRGLAEAFWRCHKPGDLVIENGFEPLDPVSTGRVPRLRGSAALVVTGGGQHPLEPVPAGGLLAWAGRRRGPLLCGDLQS
jgi:hypothetical protein